MNTKAKQIKQTRNQNSYFAHLKIYIDIHLLKPSTHLTLYFHKTRCKVSIESCLAWKRSHFGKRKVRKLHFKPLLDDLSAAEARCLFSFNVYFHKTSSAFNCTRFESSLVVVAAPLHTWFH